MIRKGQVGGIILAAIATLLFLIFIYNIYFKEKKEKTFTSLLAKVDTSKIDKIEVYPREEKGIIVTLTREGGLWMVSNGKIKVMADQGQVSGVLADHFKMSVDQLAATSKEQWRDFGVDDSLGTRVKLYMGNNLIMDIVVGTFKMSATTRRGQSFVRIADDEKVYGIDGFMSLWYNNKFNGYRNKILFQGDKGSWDSLVFTFPGDSSFTLYKDTSKNKWLIRNYEELTDSSKVEEYLNVAWGVRGENYIDTSLNLQQLKPTYSLTIHSTKYLQFIVNCYVIPQSSGDTIMAVTSSMDNTNIWNAKASDKLFERIFYSRSKFLKEISNKEKVNVSKPSKKAT